MDSSTGMQLRRRLITAIFVIIIAFFPALAAAMLLYPGQDGHPGGYRFFHEFLSALGMTSTKNGIANPISSWIFNLTLGISMLALLPFWFFRSANVLRAWARWLSFVCCSAFSLCVIGVALTPYNLNPPVHNFFADSAFVFGALGILTMLVFTRKDYYSQTYKIGWLIFAIIALAGHGLAIFLEKTGHLPVIPTHPILQKLDVAIFTAWLCTELIVCKRSLEQEETKTQDLMDQSLDVCQTQAKLS